MSALWPLPHPAAISHRMVSPELSGGVDSARPSCPVRNSAVMATATPGIPPCSPRDAIIPLEGIGPLAIPSGWPA